jgi:serine/threonine-protein phosphatase 5
MDTCELPRYVSDKGLELGDLSDLMASNKGGVDPVGQYINNWLQSDALWSDPQAENGLVHNESRNVGLIFGPDVTEFFLRKNGLRLIVRSHEGPDARIDRQDMPPMDVGFTLDHDTPAGVPIEMHML